MFPFLRNDTGGMGGLDVFVSTIDTAGNWGPPQNLKYPINSSLDDFGIVFHPEDEFIVTKPNYFNTRGSITTVGVEFSKDFEKDFLLEPIPAEPIVLPEILYDLAKWDLKPQYQDSLQGLIQTLRDNPNLVIELAAHTDTRDTEERNDILWLLSWQLIPIPGTQKNATTFFHNAGLNQLSTT